MLEVKVLFHDANGSGTREIANMNITNDGTGDSDFGSYDVVRSESGSEYAEDSTRGRVTGHNRHQSVWRLIAKAIRVGT